MDKASQLKKTVKYAAVTSAPVFFGYIFLGTAFGLLLQKAGYNFIWAFLISTFVYAGSMQFVLVSFLAAGADLLTVIFMTLMINARHIFYGLSFVDKFKKMGKAYPYMVLSLTDETYSLLCRENYPAGVDETKARFLIALLNHCYWISGSVLGALAGQYIKFDSTGIDFAMTALFVIIFIEQWSSFKSHIPALTGLACSAVSLVVFGADRFMLPALAGSAAILMLAKSKIPQEKGEE